MFQYFRACRIESWLGWIFSFGLGCVILDFPPFERAVAVFFAFSLITASVFVLNQYFDRGADAHNKAKSYLPVASGRMTPRAALIFSSSLIVSGLALVLVADIRLSPLFLFYIGLWTAYSAPPFRLKAIPVADFVVSGVGAGLLPFIMGAGLSRQLTTDVSWLVFGAVPLVLIHSGCHIIQAIGDREADSEAKINTFAVRYGKKKAATVAGLMLLVVFLSPFVYSAFGLFSYRHLLLLFILLPLSIPIAARFVNVLKNPSARAVVNVQKTARKYGAIMLASIWFYILLVKTTGFLV